MISLEQQTKLISEVERKAGSNSQKQAYIRPSEFGFGTKRDDTKKCAEFLTKTLPTKSIIIAGRDLLDITLK